MGFRPRLGASRHGESRVWLRAPFVGRHTPAGAATHSWGRNAPVGDATHQLSLFPTKRPSFV
eukprot:scaffold189772_cov30-Tisochrysis_lutea.AAC.2